MTLAGVLFTKASKESIPARQYDSVSSLLKLINLQEGVKIDAYEAEGTFIFRSRDFSGQFGVALTTGTKVENSLSSSDRFVHGFYYSKPDQPESVPLLNFVRVGRQDARILQMVENQGSLYIFKEDGLFLYSGGALQLIDSSLILEAPDSVLVLSNRIFAVTNQGLLAGIGEQSGVDIGYRIKDLIETGKATNKELYAKDTFALAHTNEKKYILFVKKGLKYIQLVFNYETNAWTSWDFDADVGIYDTKYNTLGVAKKDKFHIQNTSKGNEAYQDTDSSYKAIVQTTPITANQVGFLKHFRSGLYLWNKREFAEGRLTFSSDISLSPEYIDISGERSEGWGLLPWGLFPWGGEKVEELSDPFITPKNKGKCSRLTMGLK